MREVPAYRQQVEGHVDVFRRIYTDFYYDNYRDTRNEYKINPSFFPIFSNSAMVKIYLSAFTQMSSDRIGAREIGSEGEGWEN